MRFATRTFLFSFVPFAFLLMGSFWTIQKLVESTVRNGLRSSLRQTHDSIARVRSKSELQNSRFLRIVGENSALKAGMQLVLAEPKSGAARLTLEDQLREISQSLRFDFLLISNPDQAPLVASLPSSRQCNLWKGSGFGQIDDVSARNMGSPGKQSACPDRN